MGRTQHEAALLAGVRTGLLIDGEWRAARAGRTFSVQDPATGDDLLSVADASPDDGRAALDAAVAAQPGWARTAPRQRADVLRAAFDILTSRTEDVAVLMSLEMGKTLTEARGEVAYGAEFLRWFSEEAVRTSGRYSTSPDGASRFLVSKRPVGPCLLITPWNFPLAMVTRKVGPAIAAGCTMVLKPAELTPLTAAFLASVLQEAGLPPGVLNVVQTTDAPGVTGPLLADPRLRKISFTGSTVVGRQLLAAAAPNVLRTSMELGGNAPFVVFDDADLDEAVDGAMIAKMRNTGQACTAANRFLVHTDVAREFSRRLAQRMADLRPGPGTDSDTTVGPVIDERSRSRIHGLVTEAVDAGARVLVGGRPVPGRGWFYEPTVLGDIDPGARILREEVFGPVAPVQTFTTEEEAVAMANGTEYGLVAYLYTSDVDRIVRLSEQLETGMLGVNTGSVSNAAAPFGGIKQSGLGREGGFEGIDEYLSTQYTGIADPYRATRGRSGSPGLPA